MSSSNAAIATPIAPEIETELQRMAQGLSRDQLLWASGFLAGAAAAGVPAATSPATVSQITVLYASQTGNGRRIAENLAKRLEARGAAVTLASMSEYRKQELARETQLIALVSTHGEGDPPDAAMPLFKFLSSKRAPRLEQLRYAVLALGDSSYEHYCKAGADFDQRLSELGATPLLDRLDCDLDYQEPAATWTENVLDAVVVEDAEPATSNVIAMPARNAGPQFDRDTPFAAEVLEVQAITSRESGSPTAHVELSLAESGLSYQPGDALGVYPVNPTELVEPLADAVNLSLDAEVVAGDASAQLGVVLREQKEISQLTAKAFARWSDEAETWFSELPAAQKRETLNSWQWLDLVRRFPRSLTAQELVDALAPIEPRLYSIASAPALYSDEVHLSVARLSWDRDSEPRLGAASHFLADLEPGASSRVYVEPNQSFRLPEDDATPIIMIGAGTGIAPFRAFVDQRVETGASGANWLIFGHRHLRSDFLYQLEWLRHLKDGHLDRLDVAFSRDHKEKRYVQHVVAEHQQRIAEQLRAGGHIYICGSVAMGHAVTDTLRGADPDLLDEVEENGRLHRDLY